MALRAQLSAARGRPFDSAWSYMRVSVESASTARQLIVKGAPEVVLERARSVSAARARLGGAGDGRRGAR